MTQFELRTRHSWCTAVIWPRLHRLLENARRFPRANIPFLSFVVDRWSTLPPARGVDLAVKTVIVIGANTGINIEVAKHSAHTNAAKFISACHSKRKGRSTVSEIELAKRWKGSILPTSLP
ncbi:hypothetical protein HD554DRAFT_975948 [Boletus coccyginus]|nr:hypothetical protein HD554DRAFT_975948 [Boletus coccyginus]